MVGKSKYNKNNGFTLIELSIVIVIIGLLVGGVLGAQSLINSAQRQEVIKNIFSYKTAVDAFKLEYDSLPGDFDEAESYWGALNTDNGDGNGYISTTAETIDLWNHLGLAEIVTGDFDHNATYIVNGTSNPASSYPHVYTIGHYCRIDSTCSNWIKSVLGNKMVLMLIASNRSIASYGAQDDFTSNTYLTGLSNEDTKKIDDKIDDGNPIKGKLLAPACGDITDGDRVLSDSLSQEVLSELSDTYRLSDETKNCFFIYVY